MRLQRVRYSKALARVERDMNRIIEAVNENRLASGMGYRLKRTAHGTGLDIEVPAPEAGVAAAVKQFQLVAVFGDYITAKEWDGSAGSDVFKIAKPYHLRRTPFDGLSETLTLEDPIDGNTVYTISYSYRSNSFRVASIVKSGSALTVVERQVPIPLYTAGSLLYATEPENGTDVEADGDEVTWIDLNADARAWARKQ